MSELTLDFIIEQENEIIKGLVGETSEKDIAIFIRDLFIELKERRESELLRGGQS